MQASVRVWRVPDLVFLAGTSDGASLVASAQLVDLPAGCGRPQAPAPGLFRDSQTGSTASALGR
jgi:hypothetical protein